MQTAWAENPFSKPEWVKKFREAMRPAIRDIVNAAGDSGFEDIGVKVDFKMLDPNVVPSSNPRPALQCSGE